MAGIRVPPEDTNITQARALLTADLISDDDRSIAADSWSIKSDYGSTLDDDQRHADATEALSSALYRAASDYRLGYFRVLLIPYNSMLIGFMLIIISNYTIKLSLILFEIKF